MNSISVFLGGNKSYSLSLFFLFFLSFSCSAPTQEARTLDVEKLLADKTIDEVKSILRKTLAEYPKDVNLLYNLASIERMEGDANSAKNTALKALTGAPSDDSILLLLAEISLDRGDVEESLSYFNRLGETGLRQARAQWVYGVIRSRFGDWNQAEGCFRTAISLGEKTGSAKAALALSLLKQGKIDEAKILLQELENEKPQSPQTLQQIAESYLALGDALKAKELADELTRQRSQDANAWSLAGRAEMILLRFGESESSFTRANACPNAAPWNKVEYAEMLFAAHRENEALNQAMEAEEELSTQNIAIRNPALYNLLATLYARRGQVLLAQKYLKQSLLIDNKQIKVRQLIQQISTAKAEVPSAAPIPINSPAAAPLPSSATP
ncbi:MAG: tetratricopeptide repeat protein [Candidatus Omnitrophota bacterium]